MKVNTVFNKSNLKIICFIFIFIILLNIMNTIFIPKSSENIYNNLNIYWDMYNECSTQDGFYSLKKNSLDIIAIGSSHVITSINPCVIWNEQGIATYNFAMNSLDYLTAYYYLKEAIKTQKPRVVLFDILPNGNDPQEITVAHGTWDYLKISLNKIEGILERADKNHFDELLFPFLLYHNRWSDLTINDLRYLFKKKEDRFYGYFAFDEAIPQNEPPQDIISESITLTEYELQYLDKIISLCRENDIELVFMKTPTVIPQSWKATMDAIKEYSKEKEVVVWDFSYSTEDIGLDYNTDFIDIVHMNIIGSYKFSSYLGEKLSSSFKITDKRKNEEYCRWNENSDYFYKLFNDSELVKRNQNKMNRYEILKKLQPIEVVLSEEEMIVPAGTTFIYQQNPFYVDVDQYFKFTFQTDALPNDASLFYVDLYWEPGYDNIEQDLIINLSQNTGTYSDYIYTGINVPVEMVYFRVIIVAINDIKVKNLTVERCELNNVYE